MPYTLDKHIVDHEILGVGSGGGGGGVTGSGTTNQMAKWTGATSLGDSLFTDDGIAVYVTAPSTAALGGAFFEVDGGAYGAGIYLTSGSAITAAHGGDISVNAGSSIGANQGGSIFWAGGDSLNDEGGIIAFVAGSGFTATTAVGAHLFLAGGDGEGQVRIMPGGGNPFTSISAGLDANSITADRTLVIQDRSGTIALTTDIAFALHALCGGI